MSEKMLNQSAVKFLQDLSSSLPAPGGGGAAAYASAMGTALGMMVVNLTKGKKKYAQYEEDLGQLLEKFGVTLERFMELVQEDADNFLPLSQAYGLAQGTEKEKKHKEKVMEESLRLACSAPLEMMELSVKAMFLLEELLEKGSKLVLSDVGVGVAMLEAGLKSASLNIYINAKSMMDEKYADEIVNRTEKYLSEGDKLSENIFNQVKNRIY
ncbi:cyclodeaminase/cyclohydrolase family protein [Vagococcus elongatus]|uniref:Cyclodeaminase/cyclohydrolase domain-containing protein n=1 Tax=Vagococcus elongatus TaxID=180344 RepID=A0A430AX89_9ENTE|nr:cyclodeaminase/cyclohydrolase family protein [Vagococcus elongatus]RSU12646.1 hypothetical protein CBF29_05825 [Vagococcus elongatus]